MKRLSRPEEVPKWSNRRAKKYIHAFVAAVCSLASFARHLFDYIRIDTVVANLGERHMDSSLNCQRAGFEQLFGNLACPGKLIPSQFKV